MNHQETDAELFERLGRGDMDALDEIVRRHGRPVWAYAYRITKSPQTGEDVAQEAFLRLCRGASRYSRLASSHGLMPLLLAITRNVALNVLKHEARGEKMKLAYQARVAPTVEGPDEPLLAAEAAAKLDEAVRKLPPKYRTPFVLHEMEAWTCERIARFFHLEVSTVTSRIWRGRELLRGFLESYWKG
jgi:RNA polymerase sigma-70 factor (ECF subfamily)